MRVYICSWIAAVGRDLVQALCFIAGVLVRLVELLRLFTLKESYESFVRGSELC